MKTRILVVDYSVPQELLFDSVEDAQEHLDDLDIKCPEDVGVYEVTKEFWLETETRIKISTLAGVCWKTPSMTAKQRRN